MQDADGHENNVLWSFDIRSGQMTRVLSGPVGSEITGTGYFKLANGLTYIISAIQHPYDGAPSNISSLPIYTGTGGWIGYFGPFNLNGNDALGLQVGCV